MNRSEFWQVVRQPAPGSGQEEQVEAIRERLSECAPEDLVEFDRHFRSLLVESYTWNLWGAAYIIHGGCSDDGFDYFRGWLIAQGRQTFEGALADPDSLADKPDLEEDVELEEIWYLADEVYEAKTGNEMPEAGREIRLPELGEGWDFDDDEEMARRYPKLFSKFCS